MYYEQKNLGAFDPLTGVLNLATAATGGLFNYWGAKEAVKGQEQQAQTNLQAQYANQRAQQELLQQQLAASAAQETFGVQKDNRNIETVALMGVAGISVVIAGFFIWRATRSK